MDENFDLITAQNKFKTVFLWKKIVWFSLQFITNTQTHKPIWFKNHFTATPTFHFQCFSSSSSFLLGRKFLDLQPAFQKHYWNHQMNFSVTLFRFSIVILWNAKYLLKFYHPHFLPGPLVTPTTEILFSLSTFLTRPWSVTHLFIPSPNWKLLLQTKYRKIEAFILLIFHLNVSGSISP